MSRCSFIILVQSNKRLVIRTDVKMLIYYIGSIQEKVGEPNRCQDVHLLYWSNPTKGWWAEQMRRCSFNFYWCVCKRLLSLIFFIIRKFPAVPWGYAYWVSLIWFWIRALLFWAMSLWRISVVPYINVLWSAWGLRRMCTLSWIWGRKISALFWIGLLSRIHV